MIKNNKWIEEHAEMSRTKTQRGFPQNLLLSKEKRQSFKTLWKVNLNQVQCTVGPPEF